MVKFGLKFAAVVWFASGFAASARAADPAVPSTWRATLRSGVVVPFSPGWPRATESRLTPQPVKHIATIGTGLQGEDIRPDDILDLAPFGISSRGPIPIAPVVVLANGDEVEGWPELANDRWSLDSHLFRPIMPGGAEPANWPRGIVAAVRRTREGALLEWPRGPWDEGAARGAGATGGDGQGWRVIRPDSRVRLEPLAKTTIRRGEFRVTGAKGEWALVEAGSARPALVEIRWNADFPESFRVVVRGEEAVPGAKLRVRRPESPPSRPTVEPTIVWESGAFGFRLWIGERLVAEQTSPPGPSLACEWTEPASVTHVRCWLSFAPAVRSTPVVQPDLDAVEHFDGSFLYGDLERFGSGPVTFKDGRKVELEHVRSVHFAASYPMGAPADGWVGDLHLRTGGPAWRVAVVGLSADAIEIVHPLLGHGRIARREVTRFIPTARGRRFLLEAGRIHLGDEIRADFAHPTPRGTGWSTTVPAGLGEKPGMKAGATLWFRAGVRELGDGERVRSDLVLRVNGQRVGDLSTRVTPRNRDETVEIAIPSGLWDAAGNRIELVPDNGAIGAEHRRDGAADDIELINPSLEWREP